MRRKGVFRLNLHCSGLLHAENARFGVPSELNDEILAIVRDCASSIGAIQGQFASGSSVLPPQCLFSEALIG